MWLVIEQEIIEGYYIALGKAWGLYTTKEAATSLQDYLNSTEYADAGGEMSAVIVEVPVIS